MADASMEPMLMSEERADAYVTYPTRSRAADGQRKAFMAVSALAVAAAIVAVAAISVALTANSTSTQTATSEQQLKSQVSGVSRVASRNTKSEVSSAMLMNQPVCAQSHTGYTACLELLNTAQHLVGDLEDTSIDRAHIMLKVRNGEYNIGNAVAFSSFTDDTVDEVHPALRGALNDPTISLKVSDIADLSKCDYVWRGVACLSVIEIGRSGDCDTNQAGNCDIKVAPIIHILDGPNIVHEGGRARRAASENPTPLFSIVGGIPDRRPITEDRRRGIGGPCYSGLGERLLCHCNSSGCGYLEYRRDPSCRWGCY